MIGLLLVSVAFVVFVALSAAFSGMETGVYSMRRARLRIEAAQGDPAAQALLSLTSDPTRTVATILVANNMVNYAVAHFGDSFLALGPGAELDEVQRTVLNTLYVTPILFVLGELVPKTLFLEQPQRLVRLVLPVYGVFRWVAWPLVGPLAWLLGKLGGDDQQRADEGLLARQAVLEHLIEGDEAHRLTETQREVTRRVLELRGETARSRMIPVAEAARVPRGASPERVLETASRTGRTRLLVINDEGEAEPAYVHALEVGLEAGASGASVEHQVPTVGASARLLDVLGELQRARRPFALVRDEERAIGIVTSTSICEGLLGRTHSVREGAQTSPR